MYYLKCFLNRNLINYLWKWYKNSFKLVKNGHFKELWQPNCIRDAAPKIMQFKFGVFPRGGGGHGPTQSKREHFLPLTGSH